MSSARCSNKARAFRISGLVVVLATGMCAPAFAQNARLNPVDQGVADVGPLSASQRVVPSDLRVPTGFDRVYRLGSGSGEKYARISGGLTAVFPRSQYTPTADGYAAQTPAGTVYYIGRLPRSMLEDPVAPPRRRAVSQRADAFDNRSARSASLDRSPVSAPSAHAPGESPAARPRPAAQTASPVVEPTIFNDEAFRVRRVGALLDIAARGTPQAPNDRP